ncbi:unnamed protein product, partial [Laminaria digitata]
QVSRGGFVPLVAHLLGVHVDQPVPGGGGGQRRSHDVLSLGLQQEDRTARAQRSRTETTTGSTRTRTRTKSRRRPPPRHHVRPRASNRRSQKRGTRQKRLHTHPLRLPNLLQHRSFQHRPRNVSRKAAHRGRPT